VKAQSLTKQKRPKIIRDDYCYGRYNLQPLQFLLIRLSSVKCSLRC